MARDKTPQSKPILISSIYRQWSLPQVLGVNNSNNINNQTTRWKSVIAQWHKAHKENKEIIVMTDNNMDHNNTNFDNTNMI